MTYYLNQYCPIWYLIFNILTAKQTINCGMYFLIIFNKHVKGKNFSLCFYGEKKINFCDKTSCLEYFLLITYCCDVSL